MGEEERRGQRYFEVTGSEPLVPLAIVTGCVESGARSALIDHAALPPEFFDLSTGLAGELLHKLATYRIRLAGVVPDPSVHSESFRAFVRETNRGAWFRFFPTRAEAVGWLEST